MANNLCLMQHIQAYLVVLVPFPLQRRELQQFMNPFVGMGRNAHQNIHKVSNWINVILFSSLNQAVDNGGNLATLATSHEHVIRSAKRINSRYFR